MIYFQLKNNCSMFSSTIKALLEFIDVRILARSIKNIHPRKKREWGEETTICKYIINIMEKQLHIK